MDAAERDRDDYASAERYTRVGKAGGLRREDSIISFSHTTSAPLNHGQYLDYSELRATHYLNL